MQRKDGTPIGRAGGLPTRRSTKTTASTTTTTTTTTATSNHSDNLTGNATTAVVTTAAPANTKRNKTTSFPVEVMSASAGATSVAARRPRRNSGVASSSSAVPERKVSTLRSKQTTTTSSSTTIKGATTNASEAAATTTTTIALSKKRQKSAIGNHNKRSRKLSPLTKKSNVVDGAPPKKEVVVMVAPSTTSTSTTSRKGRTVNEAASSNNKDDNTFTATAASAPPAATIVTTTNNSTTSVSSSLFLPAFHEETNQSWNVTIVFNGRQYTSSELEDKSVISTSNILDTTATTTAPFTRKARSASLSAFGGNESTTTTTTTKSILHHPKQVGSLSFPTKTVTVTGSTTAPATVEVPSPIAEDGNFSYCAYCHLPGDVVCCDGCPQVYHPDCLPSHGQSHQDLLHDVEPWYCPTCITTATRKTSVQKPKLPHHAKRNKSNQGQQQEQQQQEDHDLSVSQEDHVKDDTPHHPQYSKMTRSKRKRPMDETQSSVAVAVAVATSMSTTKHQQQDGDEETNNDSNEEDEEEKEEVDDKQRNEEQEDEEESGDEEDGEDEEEDHPVAKEIAHPKKKIKKASAAETSSKKSGTTSYPSKKLTSKKKAKKEKKKKKKKKKHPKVRSDSVELSSPSAAASAGIIESNNTTANMGDDDGADDDVDDDDPLQGLFSTHTTGIIQAQPAFYFFLSENRLKIERSLVRKHRTFNRLPKGMERNHLIAKEGAHWWVNLPPNEVDRFIRMSMKDFEQRVVEWKEEKNIRNMTATTTPASDAADTTAQNNSVSFDQDDDERWTYDNHQRLYLKTTVGAKPFKPDLDESNNRILLELLQDTRFHPLPMIQSNRPPEEYGEMDFDKASIPFFEVHGPVATSLGDECLGCARGFAHFCNVLKRNIPAVLNRAKLQPPLSSLIATRVGLGLKEVAPEPPKVETAVDCKNVPLFSIRDDPTMSTTNALSIIPFEVLSRPTERGDDIVNFVEEVVHMKVPEPPRPAVPGSRPATTITPDTIPGRKGITSRAALPIRSRKRSSEEPSPDDVDGITVVSKCGRCRTVIESDTGCVQCRRAQLVINLSREDVDRGTTSNGISTTTPANGTADHGDIPLLKVTTAMLGRVQMKEFVPSMQTVGDEAISNHIVRQRWTPFAIMPPHTIVAPKYDPNKSIAEESNAVDIEHSEESTGEESDSTDDGDKEEKEAGCSTTKDDSAMQKNVFQRTKMSWETPIDDPLAARPNGEVGDRILSSSKRIRTSARIVAHEQSAARRDEDPAAQEMDEKDRQIIHRRFSKEKEELGKKCLSVACCGVLLGMMRRDPLQLFAEPVQAEGYSKIIKYPMDFGTMKKKVLSNSYSTFSSFLHDTQLLCENALVYNPSESVYWRTAKEMLDLLKVMQERATKWMAAIKEAHTSAFSKATKAELLDVLGRLDMLSPNSFMIKDTFRELRQSWPEAIQMLQNHDRLRKQVDSDFMRTRENEVAYYGSIAIRRAAAAAAYSLAPYPDSSGIYNVVGRRSHIEDENLRNYVAEKVVQVVEPPQLKDIPTWREEMIMRVLRKSQSRRMEGMTESPSGCARSDGIRVDHDLKSVAKNVRWGRFRKRHGGDTARVDQSRLHLSTGLGSENVQETIRKQHEGNSYNQDDLVKIKVDALKAALINIADVAVSVRTSRIHGMGLFADQPFRKGDVVAEYIGEYVSTAVTDARERIYREERIQDYQFRVGGDLVIDATKRGGHGRYINHSCDPNCVTKILKRQTDEQKRVVIVALRDIEPLEEFTYDYQFPLEIDLEARIPCNCHSELCRGFMNWDLPEKGANNLDFRTQKRGANMRDRIRRLGRPLKSEK